MKEILELIENVDPTDAAALDEIDARVWCWMRGFKFLFMTDPAQFEVEAQGEFFLNPVHRFTRSRDALKSIRPSSVRYSIECFGWEGREWVCRLPADDHSVFYSPVLKTEYLADLHAVLQAIAHEREGRIDKAKSIIKDLKESKEAVYGPEETWG